MRSPYSLPLRITAKESVSAIQVNSDWKQAPAVGQTHVPAA